MRLSKIALSIILSVLPTLLQASFFNQPIRNIAPEVYGGGTQLWEISQGNDGYVYFAAGFEFTVWDGVRWDSYLAGNGRIIRTVSYDSVSGRIYCAGDNFYGYWLMNEFGDFEMTILYINNNFSIGEVFWRAIPTKSGVYFQTHESVVWYDIDTEEHTYIISGADIGYAFDVGDRVYVQSDGRIYELVEKEVRPTPIYIDDRIVCMSLTDSGGVLISEKRGIFTHNDGVLTELNKQTNEFLGERHIFSADILPNGNYVVGTVVNGAYVVDSQSGEVTKSYNDRAGLEHTTVLSVGVDRFENIWLGLDGGIAYIENSPGESYYNSYSAKIGNVYASLLLTDRLYLGTNKGLFVVEEGREARMVEGTQGQVWDVCLCGDDVVVSHDKGLMKLDEKGAGEIFMPNTWRIEPWTGEPNLYYVADKSGFVLFKVENGRIAFRNRIEDYDGYMNYAKVDKYGNMWISGLDGEVRRLVLDKNKRKVVSNRTYEIPEARNWIGMHVLDGDVVFVCEKEAYSYDARNDVITRDDYYSNLIMLYDSETINVFQSGNYFFNFGSRNNIGLLLRDGNDFSGVKNIFGDIGNRLPPIGFRRFQQQNDSIVSFGFANGVAFYNTNSEWYERTDHVKLRKAEYSLYGNIDKVSVGSGDANLLFPYGAANVRLYFTGVSDLHNLSYSIDDSDWRWMSSEAPLQFDYLKPGNHKLIIRSDALGAPERIVNMRIEKHFTSTPVFLLLLLAGCLFLAWAGVQLYDRRVRTLEAKYVKQQEEALERERVDHENEMLSMQLKERDKQLATFAINDVGINTMLEDIDSKIVGASQGDKALAEKLAVVRDSIKKHKRSNGNWKVFETYFNGAYDGFLDKLITKYPQLTNNDLKICVLIKLGMSTKEIAGFMNIAVSSVESARYRLRKNMGLSQSESLSKLLNQI